MNSEFRSHDERNHEQRSDESKVSTKKDIRA